MRPAGLHGMPHGTPQAHGQRAPRTCANMQACMPCAHGGLAGIHASRAHVWSGVAACASDAGGLSPRDGPSVGGIGSVGKVVGVARGGSRAHGSPRGRVQGADASARVDVRGIDMRLSRLIKGCSSWRELGAVFEAHHESLNHIHVAALAAALAKMPPGARDAATAATDVVASNAGAVVGERRGQGSGDGTGRAPSSVTDDGSGAAVDSGGAEEYRSLLARVLVAAGEMAERCRPMCVWSI
eukprot:365796-Chlamydomonas_euryale.AAC.19